MNEEEVRSEIKRRKDVFRREQAALSFAEKVRISFELSKRRNTFKQARLIQRNDTVVHKQKETDRNNTSDNS